MDDIQITIDNLQCIRRGYRFPEYGKKAVDTAISAMRELQQYRERIEQLRHAEVIQFLSYQMVEYAILAILLNFWRKGKLTDEYTERDYTCKRGGKTEQRTMEELSC